MGNLNKALLLIECRPRQMKQKTKKKKKKNTRSPPREKYLNGGLIFITKGSILTAISFRCLENV